MQESPHALLFLQTLQQPGPVESLHPVAKTVPVEGSRIRGRYRSARNALRISCVSAQRTIGAKVQRRMTPSLILCQRA